MIVVSMYWMHNAYPIDRTPNATTGKKLHQRVEICFILWWKQIWTKMWLPPLPYICRITRLHLHNPIASFSRFHGSQVLLPSHIQKSCIKSFQVKQGFV